MKEHIRASLADVQDGALEIMLQVAKQTGRNNFMESFAQLFRLRSIDQIKQYVQQFASEALDAVSAAEESRSPVISKIVQDIHTRYESELSLKTLGHIYNVHPVYLGQLFKKEMGVGFTDYLNGYRIQIAKAVYEIPPTEFRSAHRGVPKG
ncbi:hypothetical protein [Paenibacillus sp. FSL H7-0714]|uniref:hypothetical protein n=1 Tax=Paenibacillus sp. FSL H7-0714 TaxID=2954735 RepID=UPI0030FBD081